MRRTTRNLLGVMTLAGSIAVAGAATAANKVDCVIMKEGRQTIQMVESQAACSKLGGTLLHKEKHKTLDHTPAKLQHKTPTHQ